MTSAELTIAEVAERTGLTRHTLRYYERDGLMLGIDRAGSGHRRYSERDLGWLELITKLRATGMPLGLMPGSLYEEKDTFLTHGDSLLLYSDGLVEAHNPQRDMFSFPYLMTLLQEDIAGHDLIDFLLNKLSAFTGPDWEQEDDVTLVTLQRTET